MLRVKRKTLALVGSGAAVLALAIAAPAVAFAEDPTPSATSSTEAPADGTDSDREERAAERRDRMAELLAAELNISKDEVAAALEQVETELRADAQEARQAELQERLDDAVAEGTLTQEQADAILAASEAGVLGDVGGWGGPGHRGPGR